MRPPSYYEELAITAQKNHDWKNAEKYWNSARAASIGHTRRDRYERRAEYARCMSVSQALSEAAEGTTE